MRTADAAKTITELDRQGRAVFTTAELRSIFPARSRAAFSSRLLRLVGQGTLQRAVRGVYVNPLTRHRLHLLENIALALRQGKTSYLSLETALGEYSIISQLTYSITVMTTGRKGRFRTPWGGIHFTHTARSHSGILAGTVDLGRPLRLANPRTALEDLRRVRRNLELVDLDLEELDVIEREMELPPPTETEQRQLLFWQRLPWAEWWQRSPPAAVTPG